MYCLPYIEREEEKIENRSKCPWNKFVCLQQEFQSLLHSGKYYVTPEMKTEVKCILKGVNTLRLNYDLFKKQESCSQPTSGFSEYDVLEAISRSLKQVMIIKKRMNKCLLQNALDLNIRQVHHRSILNLKVVQKDLAEHVENAIYYLKEYCANTGVTDRFFGYKNNLNKSFNDSLPCSSFKKSVTEAKPIQKTINCLDMEYPNRKCMPESLSTIQQKFGILVDFPGTTEYRDSYKFIEKAKLFPYVINPTPNYNVNERLMAKRIVEPLNTNYTINYKWPDANKIPLYPWLRK